MVLNLGKCHYLDKDIANESIELGKKILHVDVGQELLLIIIDKDLNFQSYTKLIIKISDQKLSPLISELNSLWLISTKRLYLTPY